MTAKDWYRMNPVNIVALGVDAVRAGCLISRKIHSLFVAIDGTIGPAVHRTPRLWEQALLVMLDVLALTPDIASPVSELLAGSLVTTLCWAAGRPLEGDAAEGSLDGRALRGYTLALLADHALPVLKRCRDNHAALFTPMTGAGLEAAVDILEALPGMELDDGTAGMADEAARDRRAMRVATGLFHACADRTVWLGTESVEGVENLFAAVSTRPDFTRARVSACV